MLLVFKQVKTVTSNANGTGFGRPAPIAPLSDKERRILQLFWRGDGAVQIAMRKKLRTEVIRPAMRLTIMTGSSTNGLLRRRGQEF